MLVAFFLFLSFDALQRAGSDHFSSWLRSGEVEVDDSRRSDPATEQEDPWVGEGRQTVGERGGAKGSEGWTGQNTKSERKPDGGRQRGRFVLSPAEDNHAGGRENFHYLIVYEAEKANAGIMLSWILVSADDPASLSTRGSFRRADIEEEELQ